MISLAFFNVIPHTTENRFNIELPFTTLFYVDFFTTDSNSIKRMDLLIVTIVVG